MNEQITFNIGKLKGVIHYASKNYIVCSHGLYSNKDSKKYIEIAQHANDVGISCVRFDFRGCGESKGEFSFNVQDKANDLYEITNYIKKNFEVSQLSLFGSSFGGMVSLLYGSKNKVNSIALLSTPSQIHIGHVSENIMSCASQCSHVLILHGLKDVIVPSEHAKIVYRNVKQPKKLMFFNADHSFSEHRERAKAIDETIKWFQRFFKSAHKSVY